ncbi:MAG: 4Fe-4S binding protein [Spirochaetes bacterium]|nr:4Fe-4S binding protein [Spirochaetota bacterium]
MIKYLKTIDDKCVGCMTCTAVCSKLYFKQENPARSAIQVNDLGKGAFHLVACDQECRLCVQECPVQAVTVTKGGFVRVDKNACVGCLACVAVCPIGAMRYYPGEKAPFKCVACGACAKECPKQALEITQKEERA